MASSKDELQRWLNTLDEDAWIGVDEGGLMLEVEGSDAYFEIGGMPEKEEEDTVPAAQIVAANLGYDAVAPKGWTSVETSTEDTSQEGFIDLPSGGTCWTRDVAKAEEKMQKKLAQIARTQKIKDAIEVITNELNGGNRRDVGAAIYGALACTHRTLQQDFWSAMLYAQLDYADNDSDLRNAEAVRMAKEVKALAEKNNWDLGLPRI